MEVIMEYPGSCLLFCLTLLRDMPLLSIMSYQQLKAKLTSGCFDTGDVNKKRHELREIFFFQFDPRHVYMQIHQGICICRFTKAYADSSCTNFHNLVFVDQMHFMQLNKYILEDDTIMHFVHKDTLLCIHIVYTNAFTLFLNLKIKLIALNWSCLKIHDSVLQYWLTINVLQLSVEIIIFFFSLILTSTKVQTHFVFMNWNISVLVHFCACAFCNL